MTLRQVAGILHRDHGVIEQEGITLAVDYDDRLINKHRCIQDISSHNQPEEE